MTDLNILSCNINGLNGPHKCTGFLDFLRRRKIDIVLVQESHLKEEDIRRCNNKFYEVVSHSSSDTKTKGVLILVRRTLNITILDKYINIYIYIYISNPYSLVIINLIFVNE